MTAPINLLPWQKIQKIRHQKMYLIATAVFISLLSLSVFLSRAILINRCHHWQQVELVTKQQLQQMQTHLSLYQQLTTLHQQNLQRQQLQTKIKRYHQQLQCHLQQALLALPANVYWQDFSMTPTDIHLSAEVDSEHLLDLWLRQWLSRDHLRLNQQSRQASRITLGQLHAELNLSTQG